MGEEARRDPRKKFLSMTVRYKSATVDEFVENHSYDVSRGGMFIKTNSPYKVGTVIKLEVRIAEEQAVISGVGRVAWARSPEHAKADSPAGMGIKYVKLDDSSRAVINNLVAARELAEGAYDSGAIALGINPNQSTFPPPSSEHSSSDRPSALGQLPNDNVDMPANLGEAQLPASEDRTVMRQTAELLESALLGAGGNLDDLGEELRNSLVEFQTPAPAPASSHSTANEDSSDEDEEEDNEDSSDEDEDEDNENSSEDSSSESAAAERPSNSKRKKAKGRKGRGGKKAKNSKSRNSLTDAQPAAVATASTASPTKDVEEAPRPSRRGSAAASIEKDPQTSSSSPMIWVGLIAGIAAILGLVVWSQSRADAPAKEEVPTIEEPTQELHKESEVENPPVEQTVYPRAYASKFQE